MNRVDILPIFPLSAAVLPGELFPLHIFEDRYRELISYCRGGKDDQSQHPFGITFVGSDGISEIGCTMEIADVLHEFEDGRSVVLTLGEGRYKILEMYSDEPFPVARVEFIEDDVDEIDTTLRSETIKLFTETLDLGGYEAQFSDDHDGKISFHLAAAIQLDPAERQELLMQLNENLRLKRLNDFLNFRLMTLKQASISSGEMLFHAVERTLH